MSKLDKYIKNKQGEKVLMKTTSLNLEERHLEFLRAKDLNLSKMIRDFLDELMLETEGDIDL